MTLRHLIPATLAAWVAFGLVQPARTLEAQGPRGSNRVIDGVRDTGQFLANDAVVARIEGQPITARDYVEGYFSTMATVRPGADSAGRAEFLRSLVTKEILERVAREVNRPLTFEDRHELRTYEERVLSNVLFQRLVLDSVRVTEEDVKRVYEEYRFQVRLRHILFDEEEDARRVRLDLLRGRIGWTDAVKKYSTAYNEHNPDGEIGWKLRPGLGAETGGKLFRLNPGEISEPVEDQDGFHLMQCIEKKPYAAPSLETLYMQIYDELRGVQIEARSRVFKQKMADEVHMTYDTLLVQSVSAQFAPPRRFVDGELSLNEHLPHFDDADTSRVLARFDGGQLTLGAFLASYQETSALMRPSVDTFDAMVSQIQSVALEPHRLLVARNMQLDKDPLALEQMKQRELRLRVEKLYQDSVQSKVWVPSAARRKYYDENIRAFFTYPAARFVAIYTPSRPFADSLAARIAAGESAEIVLERERARGRVTGSVEDRNQSEHGAFQNLIFQDMSAGETRVLGPDKGGFFTVFTVLSKDSGRQLSFEEAQGIIDNNLQNTMSERLLGEFVDRHSKRFRVETHPELLSRILLIDPFMEAR